MMLHSLQDVNNWLVKNFDYYYETVIINEIECEDCKKNNYPIIPNGNCKYRVYKKELDFYEYYQSLRYLLRFQKLDVLTKPLIKDCLNAKKSDILMEEWCNKALDFYDDNLNIKYFENVIIYQDGKLVGIKPWNTRIYKKNPFYISIAGFENIIEFKLIFDKYFDFWK